MELILCYSKNCCFLFLLMASLEDEGSDVKVSSD